MNYIYKIAALSMLILMSTVSCMHPPAEYSTEHHQTVIIGSGYGGSVSALRLGEAGVETVVFEKGRDWTVADPTKRAGTFATLDTLLH